MVLRKVALLASASALLASVTIAQAKTVCYVTAADSHPYATPANKALEARAKELGIDVLSLSQDFNVQTGVQQLNTCIARHVNGVILWPLDPQAYIPGLVRAKAAKIPVDLINTPMGDQAKPYVTSFTGPDVYSEGEMAADALNKAMGVRDRPGLAGPVSTVGDGASSVSPKARGSQCELL